jgi:hypothetical protein
LIKSETAITAFVIQGSSTHCCAKAQAILGTINTIIPVTIEIVKNKSMAG